MRAALAGGVYRQRLNPMQGPRPPGAWLGLAQLWLAWNQLLRLSGRRGVWIRKLA